MEKRMFILSVLLLVGGTGMGLLAQPRIAFEKQVHTFGTFKESEGVKTAVFEFTNTGDSPLILNRVSASCGCTTPEWTRQPVEPGAKGMVKVSYNPAGRPGSFSKTASVSSNAQNGNVILTVSGKVEERTKTIAELYPREIGPLRVAQNHLAFPVIKNNQVRDQSLELVNDTDNPVAVGFKNLPAHLKAVVNPMVVPARGKSLLSVTYDAKAANTFGFVSHRIYLSLDGSTDYKYSIGISATIEEDFSSLSPEELDSAPVAAFNTASYDFGDIQQGVKKEYSFELTNKGKRELLIRNIRSSCGCTAVSPSKKVVAAGETVPVKVVFDTTGKKGRQSKTVTVITNDPRTPTTTLRISTNIL